MRFIMLTVLIDMVSVGLIIPVLPALVGSFTSSPTAQAYWYGVIAFAFACANFVASPILGALSDRYGRRPVLLMGFSGLTFSFFLTGLAEALWVLVLTRLVSGAMNANVAVANAYVADISAPEQRARRFGLLGAMFGLGFIIGPAAGGLLGSIDLRLPFFVAGALALLNLAYGCFVLPESLPRERREPFSWQRANPVAALRGLARLEGIGALAWVIALSALAQFMLHAVWVLYTTAKFGWGPRENGWSLFAVGLMAALVQGGLMRTLLQHLTARRIVVLGLGSSALCLAAWGLATEGWMMFIVLPFNVLGFALSAAMQSLVSNAADANEQGRAMGAVASLNSLMAVVAPAIAAGLMGAVSHLPRGDWRIGAPYYVCAALQALAMVVALRHFGRERRCRRAATTAAAAAPASGSGSVPVAEAGSEAVS